MRYDKPIIELMGYTLIKSLAEDIITPPMLFVSSIEHQLHIITNIIESYHPQMIEDIYDVSKEVNFLDNNDKEHRKIISDKLNAMLEEMRNLYR